MEMSAAFDVIYIILPPPCLPDVKTIYAYIAGFPQACIWTMQWYNEY